MSHAIVQAGNDGRFSGFAQMLLVLNLNARLHHELASVSEVALSITALASLTGLSPASVLVQLKDLENRCGNADPEWVKVHGKCEAGACTCPKMLTVTKSGNVNAYALNLANFPLAPRYVAPKPEAVPAAEAKEKASVRHWPRVQPGKAAALDLGENVTLRRVLAFNADTLEPLDIILEHHLSLAEVHALVRTARAAVSETTTARKGEKKAKSVDSKRVTDFRASVSALLDAEWDEPFTPEFFARVIAAAGDEVPAEAFTARAAAELARPDKRKAKRTIHGPQILIRFAKEARMKWEQGAEKRAAAESVTRSALAKAPSVAETDALLRAFDEKARGAS